MKGFWNDAEGISITDWLASVFALGYFTVAGIMAVKLYQGTLTDRAVDFFSVFSWPVMTILGGYFGDRIASRFMGRRVLAGPGSKQGEKERLVAPRKGDGNSVYPGV